uniref:Peptidase A2 domain-containing protein n=1 Tax=Trichuris muris TaxID=70415 RepID=A0A5S6R1X8_TRIMR
MFCLLDSGSSLSLIDERALVKYGVSFTACSDRMVNLVTATGSPAEVKGYMPLHVKLGDLECTHKFWLVETLLTDIILGTDFLTCHGICLDMGRNIAYGTKIGCIPLPVPYRARDVTCLVHQPEPRVISGECDMSSDMDCAVPNFARPDEFTLPPCENPFKAVVTEFKHLFSTKPGFTNVCEHAIPTDGPPVRVPPRRVPMQYREAVENQLEVMLRQGIIRRSQSPWLAPAVYTLKKSGEVRICIDYRELNKRVRKDAYPLPLPDDIFERLGNAAVFTTPGHAFRVLADGCARGRQTEDSVLPRSWNGPV